ncbi:hypothetical protein F4803DRAFT_554474 [Xylaria telfairii]|nr:hypothetical protein F4803DRAFT_554474 [Xylaria telfairii]
MEVTESSSDHRIAHRYVATNPHTHGPPPDLRISSIEEANTYAAGWEHEANILEHDLNEARIDYVEELESELEITNSRLEHALQQRPFFDRRRQQIVSRSFVADALEQKKEIQELKKEIQELKKEINEKTNMHDSVLSLWQGALEELEDAKSSKRFLTVDDDAMTSEWKQLQFIIKSLSTSYLYGLSTSGISSLGPKELKRYRQLMPMPSEGPTENEYIHLSQILIWEFITAKILTAPTVLWGRDISNLTERLFRIVKVGNRVSASDFHAFRAGVGEIMNAATDVDLTVHDNLKTQLRKEVWPFISPENVENVIRQLDTIVDKAVNLAIIFTQSRCHYHIRTMNRRCKRLFDPNTMDNVGNQDSLRVYSIISPVFFKYGNSKGQNYDERIVLAKAAVILGDTEKLAQK